MKGACGKKTLAQMKESGDAMIGWIWGDDAIQKAEMLERRERDKLESMLLTLKRKYAIVFSA